MGKSDFERERKLISSFYDYFMKLVDDYKVRRINILSVVGFNILRYDIPLLIQKGVEYGVVSLGELNALWHGVFIIDHFQTFLPFHGMWFKDLKLDLIVRWAKRPVYGFQSAMVPERILLNGLKTDNITT